MKNENYLVTLIFVSVRSICVFQFDHFDLINSTRFEIHIYYYIASIKTKKMEKPKCEVNFKKNDHWCISDKKVYTIGKHFIERQLNTQTHTHSLTITTTIHKKLYFIHVRLHRILCNCAIIKLLFNVASQTLLRSLESASPHDLQSESVHRCHMASTHFVGRFFL